MLKNFKTSTYQPTTSEVLLKLDQDICQSDYPLDWYQPEFVPYAEEYQALPDRKFSTIVKWMEKYIKPAQDHFGDSLLLLAHYYMGGEIVKLIQHFGGFVGDSYELALRATLHPEKKIIVESAVHFMAESISILSHPDQRVFITNPKSGCTMEMMAKDFMAEPAFRDLNERYGAENILPICYMNTSGRIKAMCGAQGGAVCTSSNVKKIFEWAIKEKKKILFIPDRNMGENVAGWVGIPPEKIAYWPGGTQGAQYHLPDQNAETLNRFDNAQLVLFSSFCGVHDYYRPEMVSYWQARGYHVVTHPECPKATVDIADSHGSTAFIWRQVTTDAAGTKKYAIATENHMIQNLKQYCQALGIEVVNVGDAKISGYHGVGCGCATMSRNDPPHLVAILDLLRHGKSLNYNEIKAGDVVNEFSGLRQRLDIQGQDWVRDNAKKALENMINITES
jgi:quinolinate synthase